MRSLIPLLSAAAILAACAPPIPDSGPQGVGFENYDNYIDQKRARDAQLARGVRQAPVVAPGQPPARTEAQATAAAAVAAIRPAGAAGSTQPGAPLDATQRGVGAPAQTDNAGISDEQDFTAVASRQTIESDAQRRARQSAQYQVVQPTAVPQRPSGTVPTPIEFAVQVRHPVGQKVYSRSAIGRNKAAANCAGYLTPDLAQEAFLNAGGPSKDKLKLDPDGDGYACGWNPAKYRQLVRG